MSVWLKISKLPNLKKLGAMRSTTEALSSMGSPVYSGSLTIMVSEVTMLPALVVGMPCTATQKHSQAGPCACFACIGSPSAHFLHLPNTTTALTMKSLLQAEKCSCMAQEAAASLRENPVGEGTLDARS